MKKNTFRLQPDPSINKKEERLFGYYNYQYYNHYSIVIDIIYLLLTDRINSCINLMIYF